MILGAHPVSCFQHRLSRMYAYARTTRASVSFRKKPSPLHPPRVFHYCTAD